MSSVNNYTPERKGSSDLLVTQQLKILIGYFQISTTLVSALDIPWPPIFKAFLQAFEFLNADLVSGEGSSCINAVNFYLNFLVMICLPAGLVCGLTIFYLAPAYYLASKERVKQAPGLCFSVIGFVFTFVYCRV